MERGIYKKFEKMLEKKGFKIEKELENRMGYCYIYYAVKDDIKIEITYYTTMKWLVNEIDKIEFLNKAKKICNKYKFNIDNDICFLDDDIQLHTVWYACKENIKIYLCDTNDTSNKFKSIDINLLEKELTKN